MEIVETPILILLTGTIFDDLGDGASGEFSIFDSQRTQKKLSKICWVGPSINLQFFSRTSGSLCRMHEETITNDINVNPPLHLA